MLLIIQIALGIVLGVLLLAYWRLVFASAFLLLLVGVAIVIIVIAATSLEPYQEDLIIVAGWLTLAALAAFLSYKLFLLFREQDDNDLDRVTSVEDSGNPRRLLGVHALVALLILYGPLMAMASTDATIQNWLIVLAIMIPVLAFAHFVIWALARRIEDRRQWRIARREQLQKMKERES